MTSAFDPPKIPAGDYGRDWYGVEAQEVATYSSDGALSLADHVGANIVVEPPDDAPGLSATRPSIQEQQFAVDLDDWAMLPTTFTGEVCGISWKAALVDVQLSPTSRRIATYRVRQEI